MAMSTTAADPQPVGLRERKKRRTRDALVDAAHRLFLCHGYGRTTVDEIASEVEVSQRTFFRYFANKEEVALAVLADAEEAFLGFLRSRPAAENPLEAMRGAVREVWQSVDRGAGTGPAALELFELIESTPTLLAAHLRHTIQQEAEVARILAEREGLDPDADLRPRLLAAVFGTVVRISHLSYAAGPAADGHSMTGMLDLIERHFDQLGPALAGSWR
ncbi:MULTISPECIES: TetR family transcriptional regulator [Kitasatospora]|uniref:Putative TetR family transcriptional regulator n=1 Tax=Kitasatospora setae (strain ATCC 33774 / DSM 43861 / JCM 3304 / KCC A-0304 / NBRC 14216 / KM-6054) TaxID=452652 RepID=E4NAR8_KITSK|nr:MULTISPECIES: TetR family transcriptional regulator [Kitasatospora]BAJ28299.1 putative TetR family transcriptional regulator [Kitasatospora setae KM-6054]